MDEENYYGDEDQRRSKVLYLGIGCVLSALAIFCFTFFYNPEKREPQAPDIEPVVLENEGQNYSFVPDTKESCAKIGESAGRQDCFDRLVLGEAVNERNFEKCGQIKDAAAKNGCLLNVAKNLQDIDLCLRIADGKTQEKCVSGVAIAKKNPSLCEKLGGGDFGRQECRDRAMSFVIAESGKLEDIQHCEKIKTLEYANLCLINSFANKYGSNCDLVPEEYRDYCVANNTLSAAKEAGDCEAISNPDYKKYCLLIVEKGLTAAMRWDSDGDNIEDGNELFMKIDPENPDTDGDGLKDGEEWRVYGTDPEERDTDGDGVDDGAEIKRDRDPLNPKD